MRMLDISPEGVRLLERNTNELAFVHSPGGAKPLETPPENEGTKLPNDKVGYKRPSIIKPRRGDTRTYTQGDTMTC